MKDGIERLMAALNAADEEADVSLGGLTRNTVKEFGGEAGFAKAIKDAAENCESDATKARLIALAAELVTQTARHGEERGVGRLTDEELREGIQAALPALVEDMARSAFGEGFATVTLGEFLQKVAA